MAMLEVQDLAKVYGQGETAVRALGGLSLQVQAGSFVAIMGPSGSGKSTLLQIMGALDSPTSGTVLLDGRDIGSMSELQRTLLRREKIGFVFQSFNLISVLSAAENVALPLTLAGIPARSAEERSLRALRLVGLQDRGHHLPGELSGGQQQRVAVARALVTEPALLLADEPTGNLDSRTGQEILQLLRRSSDELGQTVVLVTHDPQAAAYADRVLFLRDGLLAGELPVPRGGRRGEAAAAILQRLELLTEKEGLSHG
ncbi:MAG: ABC transporter ATP-binding protein [Bacillota bacterium]